MKLDELSKQSGVPSKTIRHYEDKDLLLKPAKKHNGTASILTLGMSIPQNDVGGKNCGCHVVSEQSY